jgi:uncharacterized protein (TIGR02266 family)
MNDEAKKSGRRDPIRIEIMFKEYGSFIKVYMLNITNGGIFIRTDNPLPLDTPVLLRMLLPDETEALEIEGKVIWDFSKASKKSFLPKGMGIQFVNMSSAAAKKIKAVVDRFYNEIERFSIV